MSPLNSSAIFRTLACLGILLRAGAAHAQAAPAGSGQPLPPLPPSSSPPAPAPAPAPAPGTAQTPPGTAPPPYMYQEPWTPPPGAQPRPGAPGAAPAPVPPVYGQQPAYPPPPYPSPYVYEPPPPPPTYHRSPVGALWLGARLGALFPFGSAYTVDYDPSGFYAYGESWSGLASGGPVFETDLGARIARRYIVYGFWEHGIMGTGGDPTWRTQPLTMGGATFGEQKSASTDLAGLGFRWSSRPDTVGFVVDLGIGYRWFREEWDRGSMKLSGFGEFRAGFGADIRIGRTFSLSPMFMFSTGSFHDRKITLAGQAERDIPSYTGSHGTVSLTVGGHFDLGASY